MQNETTAVFAKRLHYEKTNVIQMPQKTACATMDKRSLTLLSLHGFPTFLARQHHSPPLTFGASRTCWSLWTLGTLPDKLTLPWALVSVMENPDFVEFFLDFLSLHGHFGGQEWFGNDPEP